MLDGGLTKLNSLFTHRVIGHRVRVEAEPPAGLAMVPAAEFLRAAASRGDTAPRNAHGAWRQPAAPGSARRQDSRQTTVDSKYLSRDVFAGIACEQDRCAFRSSWSPIGRNGASAASLSAPTASSVPFVMFDGKNPGTSALTVMPWRPQSPANARVKFTTAPLLV
jgi:hypothetical protein